jgi:type III secretion protein W
MTSMFEQVNMKMPPQLSFEAMAKQFMTFVSDRYPSSEKALQLAARLVPDKGVVGKIIVLSQNRDAVREVSVNQIFKSIQHRDETFTALLEALEDLEDELEEIESTPKFDSEEKTG